jgi:glycosyltransferase involved in cell wall biosynthesis
MNHIPHVAICLPSVGTHESETALSLAALSIINRSQGFNQSLLGQQQAGIADSRNTLVRNALEVEADYLLWLDADMAFSPDSMLRLLQHDKDIVGATYPRRVPPYIINGRPLQGDIFDEPLQEMEFMPFGFMLVKADVFRKIPEPWFFESCPQIGSPAEQIVAALEGAVNADLPPEFLARIGQLTEEFNIEDGEGKLKLTANRGEDGNFCRKARKYGYQIWSDSDLSKEMIHMGKQAVSIRARLPGITNQITDPEQKTELSTGKAENKYFYLDMDLAS